MPLTDRQIKNAKPAEKAYKLTDGSGLYLRYPGRWQAVVLEISHRKTVINWKISP